MEQDMVGEVGRVPERRRLLQQLRGADGKEVRMHQEIAAHSLIASGADPDGDVDILAREVGAGHGCGQAHVEIGMALGEAAEPRDQPARNQRGRRADLQQS